jgi:ubiquinone/menaquinone biosynthesis C-methylase UbiE
MAKMSFLERWLVNSRFRARLAPNEINALLRWTRLPAGATVLDMGCGPGVSTALLAEKARPRLVVAFDFDAAMVERARQRLRGDPRVGLLVADAARMPFPDGLFDAVFVLGVVHHIPEWRTALREVARVLKAGGRFGFAEPSRRHLMLVYRLLPHARESMFSVEEWRSALAEAGLRIEGEMHKLPLWDICGVAAKLAGDEPSPAPTE